MAYIKKLKDINNDTVYPQSVTAAVTNADGISLDVLHQSFVKSDSVKDVEDVAIGCENLANKVITINENSTDAQYPSAKAVYDAILANQKAGMSMVIVEELPTVDVDETKIYLLSTNSEDDAYDEYLYVNDKWERIGTTQVDLSNYYTKTEVGEQFAKLSLYNDTTINIGRKSGTDVGSNSVAEGLSTTASGNYSHAEGLSTTASEKASHAEGGTTTAQGIYSHAEGAGTTASGSGSHAEGWNTTASGHSCHAEGYNTIASGIYSHAEGYGTQALGVFQHVQGQCNIIDENNTYAHIVGNGLSDTECSNAHTLDWNGNAWYQGDIYIGSTSGINKDEGSKKLATEEFVNNKTISSTVDIGEGATLEAGTIYLVYEE